MAPSGSQRPTYVFQNGKAYAYLNGQIVASAENIEELQKIAFDGFDPGYSERSHLPMRDEGEQFDQGFGPDACPNCGYPHEPGEYECRNCGHPFATDDDHIVEPYGDDHGPADSDPYDVERGHSPWDMTASVMTPNGLKGKILGKVENIWGEETVTVRLENGRIAHLRRGEVQTIKEAAAEGSDLDVLRARLALSTEGDRESLELRKAQLREVRETAADLATKTASDKEREELHEIRVQADYELAEVKDALDHLAAEDYEGFIPEAPFQSHVVEQAEVGRSSSWIDQVHEDMVREANETDFRKLIDEAPEAFIAGSDDAVVADQGLARQVAASFIRSKTAGVEDVELRDKYEDRFLARVEEARRVELSTRKTKTHKEAATEKSEHDSLPDDALFI